MFRLNEEDKDYSDLPVVVINRVEPRLEFHVNIIGAKAFLKIFENSKNIEEIKGLEEWDIKELITKNIDSLKQFIKHHS